MSDRITTAINTYADNHTTALERLTAALRVDDAAAIATALVVLREQIKADGERYSAAVINTVQEIVNRSEDRYERMAVIITAVAQRQDDLLIELRAAMQGLSYDIAEQIRPLLPSEQSNPQP